jgi:2-polyprenyl-3-methyl-5-hydroxy-6-metoxy-1,4-benzoquinol methylase
MNPATDPPPSSTELAGRFYDALAPDYDAMTGFERRFELERPFFETFVDRYAVRRAVDAGAGTGFHSLLLARLGVEMTAVDASADMLSRARAHAASMSLSVSAVHASLLDLGRHVTIPQDALLCMGNTLAHVPAPDERDAVLAQFRQVLAPGGVLLIQTLNFDRIMKEETHRLNVKEAGGVAFVREYVPAGTRVDLRITRTPPADSAAPQRTITVKLWPVYASDLALALSNAGFADVRLHGSIALEGFEPDTSRDLVAVCTRS